MTRSLTKHLGQQSKHAGFDFVIVALYISNFSAPFLLPLLSTARCKYRITRLTELKSTRFLCQLPVEEMFNRVKKNVSLGGNSTCTPQRAMAVAIDARVLSGLNKYEEVNRDSQKHVRNFAFTKQTFRPNFSAKTMDPKLKNLNLKRIVGTTEASWFSPNAANTAAPFADILACREVAPRIFRLETAWLSRLFTPLLAVRPTGTSDWFVVVGDICAVLVKGWPLAVDSGIYTPITNNDSVAKNFVCHDIDAFEAFPLKPACPMHRACLVEVAAHGYFFGKVVRLKASWGVWGFAHRRGRCRPSSAPP